MTDCVALRGAAVLMEIAAVTSAAVVLAGHAHAGIGVLLGAAMVAAGLVGSDWLTSRALSRRGPSRPLLLVALSARQVAVMLAMLLLVVSVGANVPGLLLGVALLPIALIIAVPVAAGSREVRRAPR